MVAGVQYAMLQSIAARFSALLPNAAETIQEAFALHRVFGIQEANHIFKDEGLRFSPFYVLYYPAKDVTSAFGILESLLYAFSREWLAGETCNV